jgi:hypothetical protein
LKKPKKKAWEFRVALTSDQPKAFDILLVLGTRGGADQADATRQLTELLNAHHYTDGLSFLLNATPSNNTADAPSGFSSIDPGQEESYETERVTKTFTAGDGSNADVLTGPWP